jgi:glucokinase
LGFFTVDGELLDKWEIPTSKDEGGRFILPDVAASITAKMEEKGVSKDEVAGAGIGVPGPVRDDGTVLRCVNLGWGVFNVEEEFEGITGLPCKVGNDANMASLGEMWQGGGKGFSSIVMVTLGTGVGGGIIVGGKILEGAHGAGGEIGHAHVDDDITDPCNCGKCGCLEQVASATGVVRLAKEELLANPVVPSALRDTEVTSKAVFDAYKDGDQLATKIVNRFAKYLGTALATFACVTDPEIIVIGGGVSKAGESLTNIVGNYYRKQAFSACASTPIVLAKLGNDAGIYGAARLVL